jgi:hypothetical protein
MNANWLILLLLSFNISCERFGNKQYQSIRNVSKIDASRIAIFNYDSTNKECTKIFPNGKKSSLEDRDLVIIETAIKQIVRDQNILQVDAFKKYSKIHHSENYAIQDFMIKERNYIRRYLVVKNLKDEKEIFVSLICNDIAQHFDWKNTLQDGYGGGTCLFSFKLNLSTYKYYDLNFHSEA